MFRRIQLSESVRKEETDYRLEKEEEEEEGGMEEEEEGRE